MGYLIAALAGYLLGAVQVAPRVARRHGVDLRRAGDRNPGAWNAREQLGPRAAVPAFLGDGAKGLLAGLAGLALAGWWGGWLAVAAAIVGHAFPATARLRGGMGVMCLAGGLVALSPLTAIACLALCGAITLLRSFAWGARAGLAAVPLVQLLVDPPVRALGTVWLMAIVGALFTLRALGVRGRRSGPARSAAGARRTG